MSQISAKTNVKDSFKKAGFRPSKGLGQNFLIDKSVLKMVVEAADLKPEETIIEIGPGLGVLTQELAKRVKKVIAVEKDHRMCEKLEELLKSWNIGNVRILNGDILKLNPIPYTLKPYKVVANLPYYITSPVIRKFLESKNPPKEMVLMVQKEVAQRICAKPPNMSLLAVSVQFYAKAEIISYVSKKSFWPKSKVDSAIIKITPLKEARRSDLRASFFKVARAGFSQPRKQILNNLSNGLKLNKEGVKSLPRSEMKSLLRGWLLKNNIQPEQRAETLSIEDWVKLAKTCGYNL